MASSMPSLATGTATPFSSKTPAPPPRRLSRLAHPTLPSGSAMLVPSPLRTSRTSMAMASSMPSLATGTATPFSSTTPAPPPRRLSRLASRAVPLVPTPPPLMSQPTATPQRSPRQPSASPRPSQALTTHPQSLLPAAPLPSQKAMAPPLLIPPSPSPMPMTPTSNRPPSPSSPASNPQKMFLPSPIPLQSQAPGMHPQAS